MTDNIEQMREALIASRDQFAYYATQHHAKMTPESSKKAVVNEGMVRMINAALGEDTTSIAERIAVAVAGEDQVNIEHYLIAKRVLNVMRNPTNQMFEDSGPITDYTGENSDFDHAEWWNTMIDSAIEDADYFITGEE